MHYARFIAFASTLTVVTLASQHAFAQKIRTYGDEAEATYGTQQGATAVEQASGQTGASVNVTKVDTRPGADGQQSEDGEQQSEGEEGAEGQGTPDDYSYVTVFQPGGASAPLPVDLTPDKMYRGVIPGTRDEVSHLNKAKEQASDRSNRNMVTWVGFQANPESTRVFFQTGRESNYDVGESGDGLTVTFNDTRLSAGNFGRFIDTSFFNRNVTRIEVKQVDRTTVVATISLRTSERPNVDRRGNYLYLDFSGETAASADDATADAE